MAEENDNTVDTVTPLDGDGHNVVFPPVLGEENIAARYPNVPAQEYDTRGQTTVATPNGYAFAPSDTSIPLVTSEGVNVTKEQADAIVAESDEHDGKVFVVADKEEEVG